MGEKKKEKQMHCGKCIAINIQLSEGDQLSILGWSHSHDDFIVLWTASVTLLLQHWFSVLHYGLCWMWCLLDMSNNATSSLCSCFLHQCPAYFSCAHSLVNDIFILLLINDTDLQSFFPVLMDLHTFSISTNPSTQWSQVEHLFLLTLFSCI